jgi:hypothetical protein
MQKARKRAKSKDQELWFQGKENKNPDKFIQSLWKTKPSESILVKIKFGRNTIIAYHYPLIFEKLFFF